MTVPPLFREPLFPFAVAGGLIFLGHLVTLRENIVVTKETVQALVQGREQALGRTISNQERRAYVEQYVQGEILIHEGFARGLDKDDNVVRQRMLEIMRFLLMEEPPAPAEADLRAFLQANRSRYVEPEALSLSQVFFPDSEEARPADLLPKLRRGADYKSLGARFWLGSNLQHYPEPELATVLGPQFMKGISALPPHRWDGPIHSTQGVHFVRIDAKDPAQVPPFDILAATLRADWLNRKREEMLSQKVRELAKRYHVEISWGGR